MSSKVLIQTLEGVDHHESNSKSYSFSKFKFLQNTNARKTVSPFLGRIASDFSFPKAESYLFLIANNHNFRNS